MSSNKVLKLMKDKEIEFVDLRFTDPRGKLQHLTMDSTIVESIVRCCNLPLGSVNLKSTNSISLSFINFNTLFELIIFKFSMILISKNAVIRR